MSLTGICNGLTLPKGYNGIIGRANTVIFPGLFIVNLHYKWGRAQTYFYTFVHTRGLIIYFFVISLHPLKLYNA